VNVPQTNDTLRTLMAVAPHANAGGIELEPTTKFGGLLIRRIGKPAKHLYEFRGLSGRHLANK